MGPAHCGVGAGSAGCSGPAPAELLDLDWTAGWQGLSWGLRGWRRLRDLGRAWARQEAASLIPQAWPPQGPQSPAGAARLPLSCSTHPGGQHFPSQPAVPSPGRLCLWSGCGPWQSQPCGPGSPWLLGPFTPCPGSSQQVPAAWHGPQRSARALGPAGAHGPFLLAERHPVGHGGAAGVPPSHSALASQPLC